MSASHNDTGGKTTVNIATPEYPSSAKQGTYPASTLSGRLWQLLEISGAYAAKDRRTFWRANSSLGKFQAYRRS